MELTKQLNGDQLIIELKGEINSTTSPELEKEVMGSLSGVKSVIFDFKNVDYISSAGLRVMLITKKTVPNQGKVIIKNTNVAVKEIFDLTGFSEILDFE